MASVAGSPDTTLRALPSWANPEPSEQFEEALKALDSYKRKDPSKGLESGCELVVKADLFHSHRALQGNWERPDNEAELLQNYLFKSLPSSNSVSTEGARMAG